MTPIQSALLRSSQYLSTVAGLAPSESAYEKGFQGGLQRAALLTGLRVNAQAEINPFTLIKAAVDEILRSLACDRNNPGALDPFGAGVKRGAEVIRENLEFAENVGGFFASAKSDLAASLAVDSLLDLTPASEADYRRGVELIWHLVTIHAEELKALGREIDGTKPPFEKPVGAEAPPEAPLRDQETASLTVEKQEVALPMPDSQRQTINVLKALLRQAEQGEILEVCAVATLADGESYTCSFSPAKNRFALGGFMLSVATSRMNLNAPQTA